MNRQKIIEAELQFGIDTVLVRNETGIVLNGQTLLFLSKTPTLDIKSGLYSYIINPDKAKGEPILTFAEYKEIYENLIIELGLTNSIKARIDFRVDSNDDNFNEFLKLNKLLILLIAEQFNITNCYQSVDLLSQQDLCLRIQNYNIEVENYNKNLQEPGSEVMNRIEFRSKRLAKDTNEPAEFKRWLNRLDASATKENLNKLENKINIALEQRYQEQCSQRGFSTSEFLYKYQNSIFTIRQLSDFYRRLEFKDPYDSAKKYKKRKNFECVTLKDLRVYIEKIKTSATIFFG